MKYLREVADWIVYLQAIIGGIWCAGWLFDRTFEQILLSFKVKQAFMAYMLDWWTKRLKTEATEKRLEK